MYKKKTKLPSAFFFFFFVRDRLPPCSQAYKISRESHLLNQNKENLLFPHFGQVFVLWTETKILKTKLKPNCFELCLRCCTIGLPHLASIANQTARIHVAMCFLCSVVWWRVDSCNHIQLFRERLSQKLCTRQSWKVIWDMINTLVLDTVAVEPTFVVSFSPRRHTSMASRAILWNFFEKQWTKNYPQCLSGLSRALFPTTFLETAVMHSPHRPPFHTGDQTNWTSATRFCYHSYDYRPNWTPLGPITIINWAVIDIVIPRFLMKMTIVMMICQWKWIWPLLWHRIRSHHVNRDPQGSLSKSVFERRTSTGSEAFSFTNCLDATTFVLFSVFSLRDDSLEDLGETGTAQEHETSTSGWRSSQQHNWARKA